MPTAATGDGGVGDAPTGAGPPPLPPLRAFTTFPLAQQHQQIAASTNLMCAPTNNLLNSTLLNHCPEGQRKQTRIDVQRPATCNDAARHETDRDWIGLTKTHAHL